MSIGGEGHPLSGHLPGDGGEESSQESEEWREGEHISEPVLVQARKLIDEAGSTELAHEAIDALARHDIRPDDFRRAGPMKPKGTRRVLRFALEEPDLTAGSDEHGEYFELTFTAPSGCYATVALREITKSEY